MVPCDPNRRMLKVYGVSASRTVEVFPIAPFSNVSDATTMGSYSYSSLRMAGHENADTSATSPARYRMASAAWQPPSRNALPAPDLVTHQGCGRAGLPGFQ